MSRYILLLTSLTAVLHLPAQKCLQVNIVSTLDKIQIPANGADAFKQCSTSVNDHRQTVINNYGENMVKLDTAEAQTAMAFSVASVSGTGMPSPNAPSQQQIDQTKALAEELKNMTPDQQKAWAMQMAQQHTAAASSASQESPSNIQLVLQAQQIGSNQMRAVDNEFQAKLTAIDNEAAKEIAGIPKGDNSGCPSDVTGLKYCDCTNKIAGVYLKKRLAVQDKYNAQKISVYNEYLVKIKQLAGQVDNIVVKCNYGDALLTAQWKRSLLSAQSAAYANAILITTLCMEDIRKSGSQAYVNQLNADKNVYDISCDQNGKS